MYKRRKITRKRDNIMGRRLVKTIPILNALSAQNVDLLSKLIKSLSLMTQESDIRIECLSIKLPSFDIDGPVQAYRDLLHLYRNF